jgi:hypothetical protein
MMYDRSLSLAIFLLSHPKLLQIYTFDRIKTPVNTPLRGNYKFEFYEDENTTVISPVHHYLFDGLWATSGENDLD